MNQKDPPLGGSRGTDALDVVVWFGSTAAPSNSGSANGGAGGDRPIGLSATTGWPQRILTVGGIQHRKGEDPHSKHTAEAQQLVRQFYTLESAGVSDSDAGRLSLHRVGSSTFAPTPTHAQQQQRGRREGAAWTPGPTVKKHHLQQQQQRPMSASVMSNTSNETLPISDGHHEDRSLVVDATGVHSSSHHKSAYIPVSTTQSGASSPSGLFERRRASVAQGLPRESLSLKLFRAAMEQQDGEGSGSGSPKLLGGRPPSGKTRPPSRGRARRPSSAASAASSAASTTPSLEEARRSSSGRSTAPKTASDFPSVEKCRDLNSTLALTRAAAVLASGGSGGAVSALIGLPTTHSAAQMPVATTTGTDVDADIANNSEPGKRQGMQSRLEAAGKPARPSSAVVSALKKKASKRRQRRCSECVNWSSDDDALSSATARRHHNRY
ncbi:Hypothetical protein, putative [Bodo saltans]|uniref:Uncharacterized protein n=1 Tax=Bodo saltans TaxID=75058 RepID=A0A0S4KKU0_BODSA|nr:Hypothetical protein, putative [Bodo saltans]|eukprot:CUM57956.1 Hypothetical protein, putative [Bodo saltans]